MHTGNWLSRLELIPKYPSGQIPVEGETLANPGRGLSSCGRRTGEQDGGTQSTGDMDKVGQHPAAHGHLGKYFAGRLPTHPLPHPGCI